MINYLCKTHDKWLTLNIIYIDNEDDKKAINLFFKQVTKNIEVCNLMVYDNLHRTPLSFRIFTLETLDLRGSSNKLNKKDYKALLACNASEIYLYWDLACLVGLGDKDMPFKPRLIFYQLKLSNWECDLWKVQPDFFNCVNTFEFLFNLNFRNKIHKNRIIHFLNRSGVIVQKEKRMMMGYRGKPEVYSLKENDIYTFF